MGGSITEKVNTLHAAQFVKHLLVYQRWVIYEKSTLREP